MVTRVSDVAAYRWILSAVILACGLDSGARATEFKSGENVTIGSDEVVRDDLYMTGDTMTIEGRVVGDVVAAGRVLRIDGVVEGDLIAAAQAIVIRGEITDDVRMAGMTMKLTEGARIGDDAFVAGFSFETEAGSRVEGKTGSSGYQAALAGEHLQGLEASLVGLRIAGTVRGGVKATVNSDAGPAWWMQYMQSPVPLPRVEPGLEIGEQARIEGSLDYKSAGEALVAPGAVVTGELNHRVPVTQPVEKPSPGTRIVEAVRWLLVLLLVGSAWLWLAPTKLLEMARTAGERALASLGWGLVALLGLPFGLLLLVVLTSVVTMAFGMLSLTPGAALTLVVGLVAILILVANLWIVIFYLAPILMSYVGGRWLLTRGGSAEKSRYLSLLVGLVVLSGLSLIPFAGTVIRAIVVVAGLGAGVLWAVSSLSLGGQK